MVKKHMKGSDGMYHIHGKKYQLLKGSRAQVWHRTAYKTKGDLKRDDLKMNKHGRVVSEKKSKSAKRDNRLVKAGYHTKKGHFGWVKKDGSKTRKARKGKKSRGRK
jgi:hypothetical protein